MSTASAEPVVRAEVSTRLAARPLALLRLCRPHQWSKNLLLALPALAAHHPFDLGFLRQFGLGFAAFSLLGSITYVYNDYRDIGRDRGHPTNAWLARR